MRGRKWLTKIREILQPVPLLPPGVVSVDDPSWRQPTLPELQATKDLPRFVPQAPKGPVDVLNADDDPNFFEKVSLMRETEFPGSPNAVVLMDEEVVEAELVEDPLEDVVDIMAFDMEETPIFKELHEKADPKPEALAAELDLSIQEADSELRRMEHEMREAVAAL